ncbi:MAG: TrmH family RNA methyltransferase [Candidatus Promineifilaceae bacterium]|nr:TrmH family RNA methyltransferase [Candidatus Promineifilaceae bacterium]
MRQCTRAACRFRFPVPADTDEGKICPHCGAAAPFATAPFGGEPTEASAASGAPAGPLVEGLLDNIRSVFNVGAIFRTADGAGLRRLHLCGITATPEHPKLPKTALGAETTVPWRYTTNAVDTARALLADGCRLWALEHNERSEPLFAATPTVSGAGGDNTSTVLIAGNENAGVDPELLELCERVLHIPMQGAKESLNVAIAFGVAAYYLRYGSAVGKARDDVA